jgi:hypothetical protein
VFFSIAAVCHMDRRRRGLARLGDAPRDGE